MLGSGVVLWDAVKHMWNRIVLICLKKGPRMAEDREVKIGVEREREARSVFGKGRLKEGGGERNRVKEREREEEREGADDPIMFEERGGETERLEIRVWVKGEVC